MFWWIDEPLFRGSHNPTDDELTELSRRGVVTVVSLLVEDLQTPNYRASHLKSLGMKRYSVPIQDYSAPTVEQLYEGLELVRVRSRQGQVLIHCQGGCGRTGTVAAAYWISKGLAADEAIQRVRAVNRCAVETQVQKASLYEFAASFL